MKSWFLVCCGRVSDADVTKRPTDRKASIEHSGWAALPQDVIQAISIHLSQQDLASVRLVCSDWASLATVVLSQVTIPLAFFQHPKAHHIFQQLSNRFPRLTRINLHHTDTWCDPMLSRINLEPMVLPCNNQPQLAPLLAVTTLRELIIQDATFTRKPWSIFMLSFHTQLTSLELSFDTALWAKGQVQEELHALQGLSQLTHLQQLTLRKNAIACLGEQCLGAPHVALLAPLLQLRRLHLSSCSLDDASFAQLCSLTLVSELSLLGQIALSLQGLSAISSLCQLQQLELRKLVVDQRTVKALAAAATAAAQAAAQAQDPDNGAEPADHQQQQQQQQQPDINSSSSSSRQKEELPAALSDGDWTSLFAPLRNLRSLALTSDLCAVGGFGALRCGLRNLTALHLHAPARQLKQHTPPGWLRNPPPAAAPAAAAAAVRSLQLDGLVLLEPLLPQLALLQCLTSLVLNGACLSISHSAADRDLLTRLSPLQQLQSFTLQLKEGSPAALWMTPFAAQHLAICWTALRALHMDIPSVPAAQASETPLSLAHMAALRDLSVAQHEWDSEQGQRPGCALDFGALPPRLRSLSLEGVQVSERCFGEATRCCGATLRHLRLTCCGLTALLLVHLGRALGARLETLVVKAHHCDALGSEALGALAAGLPLLRNLALSVAHDADLSQLQPLQPQLRHLVLDCRCSGALRGARALRGFCALRLLVLPVTCSDVGYRAHVAALQQAAPGCVVRTATRLLQQYRGCRWYTDLEGSCSGRGWWQVAEPWLWQPFLRLMPE